MSEPTVFDQLFGQQPAASSGVASQLFGDSESAISVSDQLFGSTDSVESQLFDDDNDSESDDDTIEGEELESNELDSEDEELADNQEAVMRQLFGDTETAPDVASQLFGQTTNSSVEDQLFGESTSDGQSVEDQLFGNPANFVEGGLAFAGPSPELVIAMLSSLLTPKPVSGAPSVNITFQGPVTFNL